ncbi:DUF6182 family protein [Streptomyces sp. NPDC020667]|uniref:DUF6182 family protein n=1 Tax=Streptomyces sp. NPDC020667 TaxID=3154895 RepID=UPI0033BFC572
MTLSPELLLTEAARRVRAARPEISARVDLSTPAGLRAAKAEIAGHDAPGRLDAALAVCVVSRFDLPHWVRETCRFALSVPPERREPWQHAFTRTVFLSGRPDNLRERFAFDHIAPDGSAAWLGPAPEGSTTALRRLLKAFDGPRAVGSWRPTTVEIPPADGPSGRPPVHRELYVATASVTVARLLVQLNHLLAEAVMDGLIAPGDRLTLRSVPRLAGLPGPFAALRVDTDSHRPDELQAYAALTGEGDPGRAQ